MVADQLIYWHVGLTLIFAVALVVATVLLVHFLKVQGVVIALLLWILFFVVVIALAVLQIVNLINSFGTWSGEVTSWIETPSYPSATP